MDPEAERVKLLLAEKVYIEQRISSNLDLQQKVIAGGLTAVITALGWVLSAKTDMSKASLAMVLLSIVSISALSVLMAVIYGGFALGAIRFKEEVLGSELQALLATKTSVFGALRATRVGAAGRPIALATTFLYMAHVGLSVAVYVGALLTAEWGSAGRFAWSLVAGAVVAGTLLAGSIISLWTLVWAIRHTDRGERWS